MHWYHVMGTLPLLVAFILAASISIYAWRHRTLAGAPSFVLLMVAIMLWTATDLLRVISRDPETLFMWIKIGFIAVAAVPPLWLNFAFRYTGFSDRTTPSMVVLLSAIPVLTVVLAFTNSSHHLVWKSIDWLSTGRGLTAADYGLWFWIHVAYSYVMCLLGVVMFLLMYMRSPKLYRSQAIVALIAAAAPFISNLLYISGVTKTDATSIGFAVSGVVLAVGLMRLGVLDIVPVARDAVIDNLQDGMIVLDSEYRIVDMNPYAQQIFELDSSRSIGSSGLQSFAQWPELVDLCASKNDAQSEISIAESCYYITSALLYNKQRQISGRLLTLRDITESKRQRDRETKLFRELQESYDKLQELQKLKDDLTSMIVHDLRTPLTSMVMGLTAIDRSCDFEEFQREMLSMGINSGQTLLGMINDLLDINKMEDGTQTLVIGDVQPKNLIDSAILQVRPLADEKNQQIEFTCSVIPAMRADEDKLRRTIVNLLGNSIKFTPNDGSIIISASIEGSSVSFSINDTGEGIPSDALERIFEKFGQVETRKSGRKVSTGLGLTFCKMVVEAHGGKIWAESKLGEGSTFYFTVPM